ncbi:transcriptional regulator, MarR family [Lachnospiraceae bacterium KM106-2]|nr:transcriptional regulator, MarR family [Lachnospiraceae bacterium KM106-2]
MKEKKAMGQQIKRVSNLIVQRFSEQLFFADSKDLTSRQGWVIGYICEESKVRDVFQKDIEKQFNIRRSSATGMLNLLEKNGYLERCPVPHDARLKKLVLTPKAIERQKMIEENIHIFDAGLEEGISEEEKETFYLVLNKIAKNLGYEKLN